MTSEQDPWTGGDTDLVVTTNVMCVLDKSRIEALFEVVDLTLMMKGWGHGLAMLRRSLHKP